MQSGGSAHPPPDITIGELWRAQQSILASLDALTHTLQAMPALIVADVEARYSERWNSARADSEELHRQLFDRVRKLEEWREDSSPIIARTDDRVSLLQKAGWTVATLILSGDAGALFAVLSHK